MIQAGRETADRGSTVNQALGLVQGLVCSLLLAYSDSIKNHNHVDPANSGDLSGTEQFPPVPCNRARALAPWVLLVLVFGGHFLEAGVVRRLLEGWVPPPLEFNTYPFPFGTCLG